MNLDLWCEHCGSDNVTVEDTDVLAKVYHCHCDDCDADFDYDITYADPFDADIYLQD